jgi:hypothetical protein
VLFAQSALVVMAGIAHHGASPAYPNNAIQTVVQAIAARPTALDFDRAVGYPASP